MILMLARRAMERFAGRVLKSAISYSRARWSIASRASGNAFASLWARSAGVAWGGRASPSQRRHILMDWKYLSIGRSLDHFAQFESHTGGWFPVLVYLSAKYTGKRT